ncbi:MAG: 1,4-alpha-glucan branching protein GlgB, partial [Oscillospiraceae bacterium]|nr:1,4-alpha-glucan branching protein GlgB [Oscillospiraceae bacterium]
MENSIRLQRLHAGTLSDGWRWLGAHPETRDGQQGWFFRLWAPEARGVSVVGDFNRWQEGAHPLTRTGALWEGF